MHKNITFLASLLIALAFVPCFLFAQANPVVSSFKTSGPFVTGATFTITMGNVPDLTKLAPTVTLEGKSLTVTGAGKSTITGKLPEGVSKKGGKVNVRYQGVDVPYTLYVPYIDKIFLPKVEKDGQMLINGGNFDENNCNATITNSTIKITSCSQRTIFATLGNKFSGGSITVTANGVTSAPFAFEFQKPTLDFAENKDGIFPGSTLLIHAKGLSSAINENLLTLDTKLLEISSFKPKDGLIQVNLPAENAKGSLKLTVNGIESNTLALDASFPPILKDYSISDGLNVIKVKAMGKYFSSDMTKVGLSIGTKSGSVKFASENTIEAEFLRGGYSGCLAVTVYGLVSNCISFNTVHPPFLKGYQDPMEIKSENKYEWTLFAENTSDKNDKILVYVNGVKAELKERFLNRLVVKFDAVPDVGEVYVVSDGIESNRMTYDFGQRFYPFISSAISNGKFMYSQPVVIKGTNLGQHQFRKNVSVNLSGVGIMKDSETKELDWKVAPNEITIRLDDKVKAGTKATLSVSVKGKKSNEVVFVTGQESKEAFCSPWIQKIQYPEGIMEGSTIRLQGQCFNPSAEKNFIYFDTIETKPTYAKANILDVKIPKGAKPTGKIQIKTDAGTSNQSSYVSAAQTPNALTFAFEDLGANALSEIGKEVVLAKLQINNTLGDVEMQTLKFNLVYEDDKNNPNSFTKLGPLPLGEIKVTFKGVGTKTITPMLIERNGVNNYTLTLDGIRISPSSSPQTLEFRSTVKPFALNGAKLHMEFDPAKADNFSGLLLQRDKIIFIKLKQKSVSSPTITFSKTSVSCIDSDPKKANCLKTAEPSKPKLPSVPKK